jgi:hypothetical protein
LTVVQEDEQPNFAPAQVVTVTIGPQTEDNPTGQRSYYVPADEREQFDWGFKPATLVTAREEVLYEYAYPQRGYFIQALEADESVQTIAYADADEQADLAMI